MRIGVIGAGIGGLCAAIGLSRAGADVVVFERAPALRAAGSGLSVFCNGQAALEALGLGVAFRLRTRQVVTAGGQRRPDGRWLSRTPAEALQRLRIIDRAELHALLQDAAGDVRIELGVETEVDAQGVVRWGGREERFDLVVGADGIGSGVRGTVWGATALRYAGYSAWRGITAEPVALGGEAGESWGRSERFGIAPLPDGRVYWFAVASLPEGTQFADEYAEVQRRFAQWHRPIGEIIVRTRAEEISRRDIFDLAQPLASFVQDRVVLVGDAAHAMTPDLGQGGNQAMEDAATLAAVLGGLASNPCPAEADVARALARYDALRRPRSQAIARDARRLGAFAHVGGRLGPMARDLVMQLMPARAMARRLAAIEAWQVPPPIP